LGTGVGSKAYAIIEQGRVEQLINAKPEDRRLFIEEAAGTTLYRSRKLAAERKMERTRENLLRVNDVLRELDRQIQYLHRLAKKAEQYRTLREEARGLDLALSTVRWRRLGAAVADLERELAQATANEVEATGGLAALESQLAEKKTAVAAAEEELARCREASALVQAECESLQQRIDLRGRELTERDRRLDRLATEIANLENQQIELQAKVAAAEQARERCAEQLVDERAKLEGKEAEAVDVRGVAVALQESVEARKGETLGFVAREAELRNALNEQARRRDEARQRIQRLAAEWESANQRLNATEEVLAERGAEAASLRERLKEVQGEKEERAERLRTLAASRRERERRASELHASLLKVQSRLASLEEVQRNREGYQRGVRSVLSEAHPEGGVLGVVADVIEVPQQYERAVAAALGDRLQYVIVRDGSDGVEAVSALRTEDSGRGSFIPLSPRRIDLNGHGARSMNGSTRCLMDLVQVDDAFRPIAETLLGEVVLVPDLSTGLALWRRNGVYVTMVTPDGDTIDANGVITGGSDRPNEEEIVARRRLLNELSVEVGVQRELEQQALQEVERLAGEIAAEEAALGALDQDVHALTAKLIAAEKDLERLQAERPRWIDRIEVAQFESTAAREEESESTAACVRADIELQESQKQRQQLEQQLQRVQAEANAAAAAIERLNEEVTAAKVRVVECQQQQLSAHTEVEHLLAQIQRTAERRQESCRESEETRRERDELTGSIDEDTARRVARRSELESIEPALIAARSAVEAANRQLSEHDEAIQECRARLDNLRSDRSQLDVGLVEQRLRIEHLLQSVHERHGADVSLDVELDPEFDEATSEARLETVREKLLRLGEVNAGAAEELRELEERAQFLRSQKDDLQRSLDDLEKTIQKLNRASRTKFAETFAAVNEKFQQVFPRLFRGGEARLVLTDEHNLLDAGVEIVVRPPGKRLETVTLLSGGEKALVAVSLIFSLFLINPTPFCFLDEVDAPLDDANIGRFTDLVREMSDYSQFIVITHNKRTMQAASVLYGVTMQEPGVSRVISVAMH
ncbi:MAG TPA: chromosome segregation protein SMC, partial [Candidatus Acidoferrales bacterium]|nr:chromosome segregation protein SMC [Candidatus Acidoferrales bacterium]